MSEHSPTNDDEAHRAAAAAEEPQVTEWAESPGMVAQQQSANRAFIRLHQVMPGDPPESQPSVTTPLPQSPDDSLMSRFVTEKTKQEAADEEKARAIPVDKTRDPRGRSR